MNISELIEQLLYVGCGCGWEDDVKYFQKRWAVRLWWKIVVNVVSSGVGTSPPPGWDGDWKELTRLLGSRRKTDCEVIRERRERVGVDCLLQACNSLCSFLCASWEKKVLNFTNAPADKHPRRVPGDKRVWIIWTQTRLCGDLESSVHQGNKAQPCKGCPWLRVRRP